MITLPPRSIPAPATNDTRLRLTHLAAAIFALGTASVFAADAAISPKTNAAAKPEEVVTLGEFTVTGSYIKRSSFEETGSPVLSITGAEIAQTGAVAKLSDFMRYVPQNYGNWVEGNNNGGNSIFGGGDVNLRGLGPGATLVLLNGARQTRAAFASDGRVDINSLAPTIAIGRTEILKDGASSLYGTDAVAGVANFITLDDFTGTKLRSSFRTVTGFKQLSKQYTAAVLFGGQINKNTHIVEAFEWTKQTPLPNGATGFAAANVATGTSGTGFPGNFLVPNRSTTGQLAGGTTRFADPALAKVIEQNITTNPASWGTDSVLLNGQARLLFKNYSQLFDQERWINRVAVTSKLADKITFKGAFTATQSSTWWPVQPSQGVNNKTVVIPGTNPGNTFRAVNSTGQPLFAVPSVAGSLVPQRNIAGAVVLTADPTNPASGIPFNEDVTAVSYRPFSTTNLDAARNPFTSRTFRGDAGFEGQISDTWTWSLNYTHSANEQIVVIKDSLIDNLIAGVNGKLGPKGDKYFNPFGNALFAAPTSPLYNDSSIVSQIAYEGSWLYKSSLTSIEGVVTGELTKLPAGVLNLALGGQYRKETLAQIFDKTQNAGLLSGFQVQRDFSGENSTNAAFAELKVPVLNEQSNKMEISAAVRREADRFTSSSNPKVSALFRNNLIRARASYGTSFLAPTIFQRYGVGAAGFSPVTDPLSGIVTQVNAVITGSPTVHPQKSTAENFGVTLTPVKNLSISVDYWKFDFKDLLATLGTQAYVNANPRSPTIVRDTASGQISFINVPYFNAGSLKTSGLDFDLRYRYSVSDLGHFGLLLAATKTQAYDAQVLATSAVIDGVGKDNGNNFNTAIPKWRGTAGLTWDRQSHSASINLHYTPRVFLSNSPLQSADPQKTVDAQYSYDFGRAIKGLRGTVGLLNAFDQVPNVIPAYGNNFYMKELQDPTPRRAYVTLEYSF